LQTTVANPRLSQPAPVAPTAVAPSVLPAETGFYRADQGDDPSLSTTDVSQADTNLPLNTPIPALPPSGHAHKESDHGEAPASVSWTTGDAPSHVHSSAWRMRMMILSILLGAVIFLVTRDWVSSGAVVVAGMLFGVLGSRRPPSLSYQIGPQGIAIGRKQFAYNEFRAFSVFEDQSSSSVELIPLKRFMPIVLLHIDQMQKDQTIEALANYLPMQPHRQDFMDGIASRIKI